MISRSLLCFILLLSVGGQSPTRVIVLGVAQDGGVPQIGCTQEICRTQRHYVSSVAIVSGESLYLIDATPDLREQYRELIARHPQLQKKNLFDGIFLTHAHIGHYAGLLYLGKESISTRKVPVYCSREMADYLRKNAPWSLLVENENIDLRPFESGKDLLLGSLSIRPLPVPHRKEFTDTHGFLIRSEKSLLYIPDIDAWELASAQLKDWLQSSNYALLDGTFFSGDELPGRDIRLVPHPTVSHSIEFLPSMKPGAKVFFTHLNHTNPLYLKDSEPLKRVRAAGFDVAREWHEFILQ